MSHIKETADTDRLLLHMIDLELRLGLVAGKSSIDCNLSYGHMLETLRDIAERVKVAGTESFSDLNGRLKRINEYGNNAFAGVLKTLRVDPVYVVK